MKVGSKVLLTTSNWFTAPDGKSYRSVHGTIKAVHTSEKTLGFTPSRTHTNWYIEIGNMMIAGCQVLYCIECHEVDFGMVEDYTTERTIDNDSIRLAESYLRPSVIYNSDKI